MTVRFVPDGLTPDRLRAIASWLDTYDRLALAVVQAAGTDNEPAREAAAGKEIQNDLRRWADESERMTVETFLTEFQLRMEKFFLLIRDCDQRAQLYPMDAKRILGELLADFGR